MEDFALERVRKWELSCLTNFAAGISEAPLNHHEVLATGKPSTEIFARLLSAFFSRQETARALSQVERVEPTNLGTLRDSIAWLDLFGRPNDYEEAGQSSRDNSTRDHVWGVARFRTSLRKINHEGEG